MFEMIFCGSKSTLRFFQLILSSLNRLLVRRNVCWVGLVIRNLDGIAIRFLINLARRIRFYRLIARLNLLVDPAAIRIIDRIKVNFKPILGT